MAVPAAWNVDSRYLPGDQVTHDGSTYTAHEAVDGVAPPNWPWQAAAAAGGLLPVAKLTESTPYGDPGLYAPDSTDPIDGGWIDFELGATNAGLTFGVAADDSWQAVLRATVASASLTLRSDGTEVGNWQVYVQDGVSQLLGHAEVGQTDPLLQLKDAADNVLVEVQVDGDVLINTVGRGVVFKSPNGTQYRLKVADNGDLSAEAV